MQILTTILSAVAAIAPLQISVFNPKVPVVLDREYNIISELTVPSDGIATLDEVEFSVKGLPEEAVRTVRLVYAGTASAIPDRTTSIGIKAGSSKWGGGNPMWYSPSYVIESDCVVPSGDEGGLFILHDGFPLVKGDNYFYVSLEVDSAAITDLASTFEAEVGKVTVSGQSVSVSREGDTVRRLGVSVRNHGDDGVDSYRIPGLSTTPDGQLVAVYDMRWNSSLDLVDDIDVGMSRSFDGGLTWSPMETVLDMGDAGGLPEGQNGIGDPAVLVDETTGEMIVAAAWTHGLGGATGWWSARDGFDPIDTPQLMMAFSDGGGFFLTEPVNVTEQVKKREWKFSFQGPGRGITMKDGTLVFAYQHQEGEDRMPWSGIIYSKDHGETWHVSDSPVANTTEAQVAEVEPGVLMLNMRNNEKTGRRVFTTSDLGKTWKAHPSDMTLREPVCMASLISGPEKGQLLFSNPDSDKSRDHMTVKMSLDGGITWPYSLLLDEFSSWGYSCLSLIDKDTVGILYESSTSQILFQAVKISDIIGN